MQTEVVTALIGLAGSGAGAFVGVLINTKLTTYRLEQLERKVDKHNGVIEKTFRLEEQMKVVNHRIGDLEDIEKARVKK